MKRKILIIGILAAIIVALICPAVINASITKPDLVQMPFAGDPDKQPPPNNDVATVIFTPVVSLSIAGNRQLVNYNGIPLQTGLWYDAYTRIFSIGGNNRVVEISNFPRVYRGTIGDVSGIYSLWLEYTELQKVDKDNEFNIDNLVSDVYFKSSVVLTETAMATMSGKDVNTMISSKDNKEKSVKVDKSKGRQLLYIFLIRKLYDGN
jgi:hypothetical protein